ncbi:porin family protein [Spirosoma fluminis]
MQELTDDQLDGLFRKSAEEFDPPFDPAAWQAMESRLDAHDATRPRQSPISKYLLRLGLPVLVLLLTGIIWLAYNQRQPVASSAVTKQEVTVNSRVATATPNERVLTRRQKRVTDVTPEKTGDESARMTPEQTEATKEPRTNGKTLPIADDAAPLPMSSTTGKPVEVSATKGAAPTYGVVKANRTSRSRLTAVSGSGATGSQRNSRRFSLQKVNRQNKQGMTSITYTGSSLFSGTRYEANEGSSVKKRRQKPGKTELKFVDVGSETGNNQLPPVSDQANPVELPALTELRAKPGFWSKPVLAVGRDVTVQPDTLRRISAQNPPFQKGLSVRFVVSPDLSTIGLHDFTRPGTNVGMMLEYRLASRWSVQVGVLRSTKVYRASTDYYDLPAYTANWQVQPEGVSGRCNMIDIPINLRYDLLLRPAPNGQGVNRWFVSGGATSYIMRQEDYDYEYADPNNPHIYPDRRGWHGNTGDYKFSQLNLSAGYERTFSRRLSWQIEPFLKMPLKKIGYYKLNLLSTGAFFSIRYKL